LVPHSETHHLDIFPSATGGISRLAYVRAKEEGIEVELLLRKAGLTHQQIDDQNARLSVQSQIRFLELVAKALRDEFLGFHLAQKFDPRKIGLLYYVAASSDSLEEALQRAARYTTIVNEGVAVKYRRGNGIVLSFDYVGVARHSDRDQIEFLMATLVRICRQLTDRRLPASRVSLTHRRSGNTSELDAFFGCSVMFGAAVDEVAFRAPNGKMPVVSADSYLNELLIKYCEDALVARATKRNAFGVRVENAIGLLLPHGKAQAGEVARKLGVSQRTLTRRLSSEGLKFGDVLRRIRADLAKRHLADEALSVSKIAWLLGYQDVSAFTHAFKRWTGGTPRAARHGLR
jgi:AraC-like DNA-binding protein